MFHYHINFSFGVSNDPITDADIHADSPEQACQALRQSAGGDIVITNVKLLETKELPAPDAHDVDSVDVEDPDETQSAA